MKDIIVTGGRNYDDWVMMQDVLSLFDIGCLVQGGASGADQLALEYAKLNNIDYHTIEADWEKHGKAAGPIRNTEMLAKYPNAVVVAFPGGKGTADCVKQAVSRNMVVLMVHK